MYICYTYCFSLFIIQCVFVDFILILFSTSDIYTYNNILYQSSRERYSDDFALGIICIRSMILFFFFPFFSIQYDHFHYIISQYSLAYSDKAYLILLSFKYFFKFFFCFVHFFFFRFSLSRHFSALIHQCLFLYYMQIFYISWLRLIPNST